MSKNLCPVSLSKRVQKYKVLQYKPNIIQSFFNLFLKENTKNLKTRKIKKKKISAMPKREAKGRKHRPKTPQKTMDQRDKDTTVLAAVPKTCCWHTKATLLAHQSNLAGTPTKLQKKDEKKGGGPTKRGSQASMQHVYINHPTLRAPLISKAGNPCRLLHFGFPL